MHDAYQSIHQISLFPYYPRSPNVVCSDISNPLPQILDAQARKPIF